MFSICNCNNTPSVYQLTLSYDTITMLPNIAIIVPNWASFYSCFGNIQYHSDKVQCCFTWGQNMLCCPLWLCGA